MDIEMYNKLEIGDEIFVEKHGFSGNFIIVGLDVNDSKNKCLVQLESSPEEIEMRRTFDCVDVRLSFCTDFDESIIDCEECGFWVSADDVVRLINANNKKVFWRV